MHIMVSILCEDISEDLWHHLRRLGLNEIDDKHPVFRNIKQAVETLFQQRCLLKDKVIGPEGNTMMYELAERATDSSLNMRLKEYICCRDCSQSGLGRSKMIDNSNKLRNDSS
ncbi:hypothetical protein H6P81_011449 [Aristolochia fimbriata]|uniref:MAGE domain-containing protein n=1 Tax=Aristolochia fimbriata TaxID=158543 RepID=A0AAV7ES99_ARIFI|nr:hypothetical protein H6P81_011449 [Aristolochia fimbriata]